MGENHLLLVYGLLWLAVWTLSVIASESNERGNLVGDCFVSRALGVLAMTYVRFVVCIYAANQTNPKFKREEVKRGQKSEDRVSPDPDQPDG